MFIKVRVKTGMKKESIIKTADAHFAISVREKPQQNMANKRIIALIAKHFKIPTGKVKILNGHHSPSKLLSVDI